MMDFIDDISLDVARAAHRNTSFSSDERGVQERNGYAATLTADYEALAKLADTDEKREMLAAEFARYREGFKARKLAQLHAHARCASSMITGPSNFPVRQMEKRNATEHRRLEELIEFRQRALAVIRKTLCPEDRPIMSGDSDAVERLKAEIERAERTQEIMKAVNVAIRQHAKDGSEKQIAACVEAGLTDVQAREILLGTRDTVAVRFDGRTAFAGRGGFASSSMTNNNANIRRMKERLLVVERNQARPAVAVDGANGIRLEDVPAENRVRLFFPGKPSAEIRARLKPTFRWAPSLPGKPWQAYRNAASLSLAREIAGAEAAPTVREDREIAPRDRVRRRRWPEQLGTVVRTHPAGESCPTCNGSPAHAVVVWDDGPGEFDEAPADLEVA